MNIYFRSMHATTLLRWAVGLLAGLGLAIVSLSLLTILNFKNEINDLTGQTVAELVRLDELGSAAFEGAEYAASLIGRNTASEAASLLALIGDNSEQMRAEIDQLSSEDGHMREAASKDLATIEETAGALRALKIQDTTDPQQNVRILTELIAASRLLEERFTKKKLELLANIVAGNSQGAALDINRLSQSVLKLRGVQGGFQSMIDAESVTTFDRARDLTKLQFAELFSTLARMNPDDFRADAGMQARDIYERFEGSPNIALVRDQLDRNVKLSSLANDLVGQYRVLKLHLSEMVGQQRTIVEDRANRLRIQTQRSSQLLVGALVAFVLIAAFLIFVVVENRFIQRLKQIDHQIRQIRTGYLGPAFIQPEPDEMGDISRSVEDLRILTLEQKRLEGRLRVAKAEAETAAEAKSEFLSMMSHEVRTPLNAIMGLFELIENADIPERQKNRARHGRSAAESLFDLLSKVLDASRIEAGKLTLNPEQVDVGLMIARVASMLEGSASKSGKPIRTRVEAEDGLPSMAILDGERLYQVLVNLNDNAVRFTDAGSVTLCVAARDSETGKVLEFVVEDTGIGIPDEQKAQVFEKFRQADAGKKRKRGGSGLGLPISKEIVDLMGGTLEMQSLVGHGTRFIVTLPCEMHPVPVGAR